MRFSGYLLFVVALLSLAFPADANPRANYLLHCGGCHLPSGIGVPPEVPTLHHELGPIFATAEGRTYLVRVPGASQTPLNDRDLAAVINWVLTEYNGATLPKNFIPLTEEEVRKARSQVLADPLKYRARLWPDY